jgi:hypothetical protein
MVCLPSQKSVFLNLTVKDLMEPFNTLSNTIIFKNRNGTLVKTTIDEYTPIYVHSAYSIGTINGLAYVGPSQYLTQQ